MTIKKIWFVFCIVGALAVGLAVGNECSARGYEKEIDELKKAHKDELDEWLYDGYEYGRKEACDEVREALNDIWIDVDMNVNAGRNDVVKQILTRESMLAYLAHCVDGFTLY